jgi:hypothetical protein
MMSIPEQPAVPVRTERGDLADSLDGVAEAWRLNDGRILLKFPCPTCGQRTSMYLPADALSGEAKTPSTATEVKRTVWEKIRKVFQW